MHKYEVTDSKGQVHTRQTMRTYMHAVVVHYPGHDAIDRVDSKGERYQYPAIPAYSKAQWCGRHDLAVKALAQARKAGFRAEMHPAQCKK